ncbi:MAG TPA: hypothetical protein VFE24_12805 [Pirellulales bacterium]|jgi:hypothetical protein|nr:hypothetical protein [Pirellulales bacterium]
MLIHPQRINNLENLRAYINETLCHHDQLEINAFQMTERVLVRSGKPCGIFFCLHGPREVKFTAIWESESNSVFFYGSSGARFHKAQLARVVSLEAWPGD